MRRRKKIEGKLKCVLRREWKEQIINFGISFQLKVTGTTHKKKQIQNEAAESCRYRGDVSSSRYAKRCFFYPVRKGKKARRRSSLIVPFFKASFLSCAIYWVARSTDQKLSYLFLHLKSSRCDHGGALWELSLAVFFTCSRRNLFRRHFTPNLSSVFYCFSFAFLNQLEKFCFLIKVSRHYTIWRYCGRAGDYAAVCGLKRCLLIC